MVLFLFLSTSSGNKDSALQTLTSEEGCESSDEMEIDTDAPMEVDENEGTNQHVHNVHELHFSPKVTHGRMNDRLMGEISKW